MSRFHEIATRLPPPLLFVIPLLVGPHLDRLVPLSTRTGDATTVALAAGWALIAVAIATMGAAIGLFARRRTTIVPHGHASALVTTGPFRWTRNPMYVGLTTLSVGVCAVTSCAWSLVLLPAPLLLLARVIIPMEERSMHAVFGTQYDAYAGRVPRWL